MKSKLSRLVIGLFACMAIILILNVKIYADSANVSVSSVSGSAGDTVSVSVSVTPDTDVMAQLAIAYDTNFLEYVSGGTNGVAGIVMEILDDVKAGSTGEFVINFRLRTAGTTTVSVADNTQIYAINGNDDAPISNINKTNGTVTINATTAASNDSHLSGLNVQAVSQNGDSTAVIYTPSFSPDIYEYRADLPSTTARLVVSTTLSDTNATTKVSGTRIDPGNNKTTITVVAEDGSESQYIIYTTRQSETTTEPTTEGESSSEETTTAFDRSPKAIKSLDKYLIQDFSLITIPEGFEEGTAEYEGKTIAVLKGIAKELTLVCLADDAQGTNAEIYIFNEASGSMDKMINITSLQKMYTIIPTDDSYVGPEGYAQTNLDINGVSVKAWIKEEGSEFYVVYAMNWNGEKALYVYDTKEQTMQRFVEGNKSQTFEDEPEEENKEYLAMKKKYDDMYREYVNDHSKKNKIIIALIVVIVAAIVGFIIILSKKKISGRNLSEEDFEEDLEEDSEEDIEEDSEEDLEEDSEEDLEEIGEEIQHEELNPDMVAQPDKMWEDKLSKEPDEVSETEEPEETEYIEETTEPDEENYASDAAEDEDSKQVSENNRQMSDIEDFADERSDDEVLIDMDDDEPFEIEFLDLGDDDK